MAASLGIIADDLTGANDTGVQFARDGARTLVPFEWHDLSVLGRQADVVVLNTNSRAASPRVAAQRARIAAQALRKAGIPAVYKKIDSTFRGNVGAELDAILDVYPVSLAVLTPAFPPARRAVRDGVLLVDGTPVHETSIGADPVTPVKESHLPTLLARQLSRPIHALPLPLLRQGLPAVTRLFRSWQGPSPGVVLADAVTPLDLQRLARAILKGNLFGLAAGSAGLAMALSALLPWKRRKRPSRPVARSPILAVVGSRNPTSLEQIRWLEEQRHLTAVRACIREVGAGRDRFQRELDRVSAKLQAELCAGRDAVLTLAQPAAPRRPRPPSPSASASLSEFLGDAACLASRKAPLGGLILCGGDIAVATCRALGAGGLELYGEVEPGVPCGRLAGGPCDGLPAVTKAGGFGKPDAFARAMRYLSRGARRAA
ncbi:MAG: four-carbon acid sugar kinase family protein [Candidatus Methylomirabilota bacterium]